MISISFFAAFIAGVLFGYVFFTDTVRKNAAFWEKQADDWSKICDEKNAKITELINTREVIDKEIKDLNKQLSIGYTLVLVDTTPLQRKQKPEIREWYKIMGYERIYDGVWVKPFDSILKHHENVRQVNDHATLHGYNFKAGTLRNYVDHDFFIQEEPDQSE